MDEDPIAQPDSELMDHLAELRNDHSVTQNLEGMLEVSQDLDYAHPVPAMKENAHHLRERARLIVENMESLLIELNKL